MLIHLSTSTTFVFMRRERINISKEEFVQAIEDVKRVYKYQDNLNSFFKKHGTRGSIYQPNCATTVLKILHNIYSDTDIDDLISYFCIDLDFGKKYEEGCVKDVHGVNINLSSAESLYEHLNKAV